MRHDLDGQPVEPVSAEHRVEARRQMADLEARRAEARAAYLASLAAKRAGKGGGMA
jgi:sRNA-binding protein